MSDARCGDCGARVGEFHKFGCDMERCPFCGGQLISCDCVYKQLKIDVSPGTWAYEHGLTQKQEQQWLKLLQKKGRIPYVPEPVLCAMCGKVFPEFFGVPDSDWKKYVIPSLQNKVLCRRCYDAMVKLFPHGWRKGRVTYAVKGTQSKLGKSRSGVYLASTHSR